MTIRLLKVGLALVVGVAVIGLGISMSAQRGTTIEVYKTATCGCCALWVKHLQANGFTTRVTDMEDLTEIKKKHGVPAKATSCHTAIVDGYALEGHVPAADVRRLLKERPAVAGLAVPGMPLGSPGMEFGDTKQPYNVLTFDKGGALEVFSSYGR
jgi:hypothetical protein